MIQQQLEMCGEPGFTPDLMRKNTFVNNDTVLNDDLNGLFTHGSWPENEMLEMISGQPGISEMQLLIPLMKSAIKKHKKVEHVKINGISSYGIKNLKILSNED